MLTFYEAMLAAMEERGYKAADMVALTGFHPSYFSRLKSGRIKDPTWDKALGIIAALGMTPDEFYAIQRDG